LDSGYSIASEVPPGYSPDFVTFLFHDPRHLLLQSDRWEHFFLITKSTKKIKAQLSVHIDQEIAMSPVSAPFGSFLYSEDISPETLFEFIGECELSLQRRGVKTIRLVEPPLYYRKSGDILHTLLFNRGFSALNVEISCGIKVDVLNFEEKLASSAKRKLRTGRAKGLRFKILPITNLEMVYQFILKCRTERGHTLSMTFDNLRDTVDIFKDRFYLFGAMLEKEHVAASIAIQVGPDILYNFYPGYLKKFEAISPLVFLTAGMYKFCESKRIPLLDLGTSAVNGQPNFGLLDFKVRLGGVPSIKFTFEKNL
jgi:hypothetical protein